MESTLNEIWTIGHSTHPPDVFLDLLKGQGIGLLIDVRNFPGSRRYPHFNKETLESWLQAAGIRYLHLKALGGRRKPVEDSINNRWRNTAFRGYADHMGSEAFKEDLQILIEEARQIRTCYMCSEAVWWSCHRALISDLLKSIDWKVTHILSANKTQEHPYTSAARIENGELRYDEPGIFGMDQQ
jgi:uncharacterized protein (DUF488 family)